MDTNILLQDIRKLAAKFSNIKYYTLEPIEVREVFEAAKQFADLFRDLDMLITNDKTLPEAWND